jgi:uncharacterized membrane protein
VSLAKLITDVRSSLWFIPGITVLFCTALALGAVEIDRFLGEEMAERYPRLFGARAEGSRQLLAAIASSTITVAGVVFSITIVTLSLAAAQYSPRVLRNFMSDRANQVVLGVFVGVFVYCVLVLRTVRGGEDAFIPGMSILIAIALALTGIAFLIFFIHHIATSIQVSEMAARIAGETLQGLQSRSWERVANDDECLDAQLDEVAWVTIRAPASGYMQRVDEDALVAWAREHQRIVRVGKPVGAFVVSGECVISVSGSTPPGESDADTLDAALALNTYRDLGQDPAFGLQQLVDIASKALSPGVNDTGTARDALNYITCILNEIVQAPTPGRRYRTSGGRIALVMRVRSFEEYLQLAYGPLRRNATRNLEVMQHLIDSLGLLASTSTEPRVRQALAGEIAAADEAFESGTLSSTDKLRFAASVREALAQANGKVEAMQVGG